MSGRSGALVLAYHRFRTPRRPPVPADPDAVAAEALDAQMRHLRRHFDVVGPEDLPAALTGRRERVVVVTVDDGYRDGYEIALPVFAAHHVPATYFIATGFPDGAAQAWWEELRRMVERATVPVLPAGPWLPEPLPLRGRAREPAIRVLQRAYAQLPAEETAAFLARVGEAAGTGRLPADPSGTWMSWDEIRALRRAGMRIGGHSAHHPVLSRLAPAAQRAEVARCRARIEAELGEPMRWFAYPVGGRDAFDGHTKDALREQGVELAFSCYGGWASPYGALSPYDIPRATVGPRVDLPGFRRLTGLPAAFARW
jgi:peptidoglycan/xylan/chitin deacetylase (PgdA/CDA1 family)